MSLSVSRTTVWMLRKMTGNVNLRIIRSVYVATDTKYQSFHGRPVKSQPG